MSWQQFLMLAVVLGVAAIFVWRSSSPKKHEHDANCGCGHDHDGESQKKKISR